MAEIRKKRTRQLKNRVGIEQSPLVVSLYRHFGDWKMDTIVGENGKGAILTFVERTTAFCIAQKLPKGEKGLVENTNKLIRLYIPKKSNLNKFSNNIIKQIQCRINERPRYKLNFYSPKEIFFLNLNQKVVFNS